MNRPVQLGIIKTTKADKIVESVCLEKYKTIMADLNVMPVYLVCMRPLRNPQLATIARKVIIKTKKGRETVLRNEEELCLVEWCINLSKVAY